MKPSDQAPAGPATDPAPGAPANDYDAVTYPGAVYIDTMPDRLATIAILAGMQPASPARCRVLELGCGDGMNLLAMAYGMPESEFVGIDPAAQPIARGQAMSARLEMAHVSLRQMSVEEVGEEEVSEELGQFDYIVAHGLYSWVPEAVREKVMAVCRDRLTENGVAFISYNAYPGGHLRELVRGMMRYHAANCAAPEEQVRQARGLIRFLSESVKEGSLYQQILAAQMDRISGYEDGGLFHDDLNVNNQPFYFHEFMAVAERHGLQYVGEAELSALRELDCPPKAQAILQQLDPGDIVRSEQYRDFLGLKGFRQTLLCRKEVALLRGLHPENLASLAVSGEIRPALEPPAAPDAPEQFLGWKNTNLETDRPLVKAALRRLGPVWPAAIPFCDLLAQARNDLGRVGEKQAAEDREELAMALLEASIAGILELCTHRPRMVVEPSEKPKASALARLQLERGDQVSTLVHATVRIDNQLGRSLLSLLDGTRDRASLRAAMEEAMRTAETAPITERAIEEGLIKLARLALLEE